MSVRGITIACASLALITLAGCNRNNTGSKTEESSAENIAVALDACADARSGFAQSVCSNRTLASLDSAARDTLVAESAASLRRGRGAAGCRIKTAGGTRSGSICGVHRSRSRAVRRTAKLPRKPEFRARAQEAGDAVQEVGGYTFQRMELVDASPVTAEIARSTGLDDGAPEAVIATFAFRALMAARPPRSQRFNDLVAQQPQFRLEDATNEVVDYRIAFAGPELISVRFNLSSDTLGAAHGNNTFKAVTVLMEQGRALEAGDVFRAGSGWEQFLTQRAVREIGANSAKMASHRLSATCRKA
jgi:hypothetical protein